ncbi:hypothetical protein DMB68_16100 [Flavobacterium hydrophilum]|uniref:Uncharacterized protein n=1 Tax=Flavobacterium hydrophilum TaxID=2211445 RepID=A0A2V4CCZ5_9FLAO|nr:hypothetical protein DMB68_16100 [Flavobacterium hydrophilum]
MNWTFIGGHWILTLLCGPIIFILKNAVSNLSDHNIFGFIELYPIMLIMGFAFSIPTYLLFSLIFVVLKNQNIRTIYTKIFFILIVVIGIWITTALISGTLWSDIAISYSITAVITGIFLKSDSKLTHQT